MGDVKAAKKPLTPQEIHATCIKALGLSATATMDDIEVAVKHRFGLPMSATTAELIAARNATVKVNEERAAATARLRDKALDAAIGAGKITASSRAAWAADFDRDPEATVAVLTRLPAATTAAGAQPAAEDASLIFRGPGGLFTGGRPAA
jgi:hypothetical protein